MHKVFTDPACALLPPPKPLPEAARREAGGGGGRGTTDTHTAGESAGGLGGMSAPACGIREGRRDGAKLSAESDRDRRSLRKKV